jgi:hypothetical protein
MLIREAGKGQHGKSGAEDKRRVEKDKTRLSREGIIFGLSAQCLPGFSNVTIIPKVTKMAPMTAVDVRQPVTFSIRNISGAVRTPKMAGSIRMAT